jgi:hypothetical protein
MLTGTRDLRAAFHDVRNLLLAIESQTVAVLARLDAGHPSRPGIGAIQSSARRATAALEKVRLVDRTAESPPTDAAAVTDIAAVLEGIAPVVEQQTGDIARLSMRLPAAPAIVDGNPSRIQDALFDLGNVLGSAMYHPGMVAVAARVVALPSETGSPGRRVVEIELQADGRTLTEAETDLVRTMIESSGGRLLIGDTAGTGSSARVLFPARTS